MPLSPLSRSLAALIVALVAAALLLPDRWLPALLPAAAGLLAVLLGGFTWSAVQNIPPFDDRAFHLALPPGRAGGFRRLVSHHTFLLGGIALVIAGRCVYLGGSWLTGLTAAFLFCLPMLALCAAVAATASLASRRGHWRLLAWCALGLPAVISLYFLNRDSSGAADWNARYYIPGTWMAVLVACVLFLLSLCLAVLRRAKRAALILMAITAALLPWVAARGGRKSRFDWQRQLPEWMLVAEPGPRPVTAALVRKIPPPAAGHWGAATVKLPEVLELRGIAEGEFVQLRNMRVEGLGKMASDLTVTRHYFSPAMPSITELEVLWAGKSGDRTLWGEEGAWEYLRSRVPAHEKFEYGSGRLAQAPDDFLLTLPVPLTAPPPPEREQGAGIGDPDPRLLEEILKVRPWHVGLIGPLRWEAAKPIDVVRGGSSRLPCGIFLEVLPARRDIRSLTLRIYGNRPTILDPWRFGEVFGEQVWTGAPRILLLDEDGKTAIALDAMTQGFQSDPHFMEYEDWTLNDSPRSKTIETMPGGRLYIFLPVLQKGGFGGGELPPP